MTFVAYSADFGFIGQMQFTSFSWQDRWCYPEQKNERAYTELLPAPNHRTRNLPESAGHLPPVRAVHPIGTRIIKMSLFLFVAYCCCCVYFLVVLL